MQIIQPHSRPPEAESLSVGPRNMFQQAIPIILSAHSCLRSTGLEDS